MKKEKEKDKEERDSAELKEVIMRIISQISHSAILDPSKLFEFQLIFICDRHKSSK